jgi:predicted permease
MNSFLRKVLWLTRRSAREAELREELQFHLEEEAEERERDGLANDEARWAARRELGNLPLIAEDTRAAWGWVALEQFGRDAAYGLRQIRRNPSFSGVAIATLALGIGGVTSMFSAFDAVLVRPLPYADADRLVMIWDDMTGERRSGHAPAPAEWLEWRRHNRVFTDLAATQPADATLSGDGAAEQVPARKATANLWSVLGAPPRIGRAFTEEEDEKGAAVAVISHGLWQRRYGGSPDVLGRRITVNDTVYEVVGVMPRDFYFMPARDIDIWMPASLPAWMRKSFTWHDAQVVARLRPGVTLDLAQESMAAFSRQLTAKDFRGPHSVVVKPLREEMAGKTRAALVALLGASAALLMIACVNLANLLMSRGTARGREVAVRAALGAGRGRLIAQFLTESLVLAALGAVAGMALAMPAMRFLETIVPETMGTVRLVLDGRVLAFSAGVAMAAAVIFGLVPALRGSRRSPLEGLRDGGRGRAGGSSHWLQHSLILVELALAVALLTSGGLLLQSFRHLASTDLGLRPERLLTGEMPLFRYDELDRRVAFVNTALERIRAVPGVRGAGAISRIPLTPADQATFYLFPGQSEDATPKQVALFRVVTRDYFSTVGARLREGRFFEASDQRSGAPAAVVNDTFASRNFPGRSPVGARLKFGQLGEKGYWYTIVGVVDRIREVTIAEEPRPAVYLLHEQTDQWEGKGARPSWIVVRTDAEPASIVPAVRQAIQSLDGNQPLWRVQTLEEIVDRQLQTPRQTTALMSAFALLALLLASLGIYGVLSYAVTQRTSEIGVRMALGASPGQIWLSFGKRGLVLTLTGLAIGLALAAMAARSMSALLYGFRPDYGPTAAVVSLVLLAVALSASFVPAHRASRVDPMVALRNE